MARQPSELKIAAIWAAAATVATVLVIPYAMALMPTMLEQIEESGIPLPVVVLLQLVQAAVIMFLLAWGGLKMGRRVGLGSPWVASWLGGPRVVLDRGAVVQTMALGLVLGLAVLALDRWLFFPRLPEPVVEVSFEIPRWKGFLASFYGGIAEELQMRLFLMSLLVWVGARIGYRGRPAPSWLYVVAALVAASLFAVGHLPAAGAIWPLSSAVVVRVLVLNSLVGIPLGLLFWRRGLEHAVIAHFCADLGLHVVGGS